MGAPPAGPTAVGLLVPQWLLIAVSLIVILLRLNLRLKVQRTSLTVSDYFMCAAWLSAVATASFDIEFARMGVLDPEMDYLLIQYRGPPEDIEYILKVSMAGPHVPPPMRLDNNTSPHLQLLWASQFPFFLTFNLAKATLLSIYMRLFPVFMVKRRIVVWAVIVYCAAAFVATIFLTLFICYPVERNWS